RPRRFGAASPADEENDKQLKSLVMYSPWRPIRFAGPMATPQPIGGDTDLSKRFCESYQFLRRYPVAKNQETMAMHSARKPTVTARLNPTCTSAVSKKLQRKPEIK